MSCENMTNSFNESDYLDNTSCSQDNGTLSDNNSRAFTSDKLEVLQNFILNVLIVAFHVIAIILILSLKSINPSLRVFLMSLSMPGLLANGTWAVGRGMMVWQRGPLMASEYGCKCIIFTTQLTSLSAHLTVVGLAVNNFLAVSYPLKFKRWVTTLRVFIYVVCIWTFWALFGLIGTLVRGYSKTMYCSRMLISQVYELATEAIVMSLTMATVGVLNYKILFKIKGQLKIRPSVRGQMTPDYPRGSNNNVSPTENLRPSNNADIAVFRNLIFTAGATRKKNTTGEEHTAEASPERSTRAENSQINNSKQMNLLTVFTSQQRTTSGKRAKLPQIGNNENPRPDNDFNSQSTSQAENPGGNFSTADNNASHQLQENPRRSHGSRQSQVRNVAITLLILSLWNSVAQIPFLVVILVSIAERDQASSESRKFLNSTANMIARLGTVGNTFIYAWRFIKWKAVFAGLNRRRTFSCCR